ncbi:MAG: hypothetical protein HKM24_03895, partial [Gammaproteobacteria bacterium]|nr:hypothetical protein [Gammaproteobacteria bacterium]
MKTYLTTSRVARLIILICCTQLFACSSILTNAVDNISANLTTAVLNQDDPELVRDAVPAYLILLDGFVEGSPDSPSMLSSASSLYAAYGSVFVDDIERSKKLSNRAREYGQRAMCSSIPSSCHWQELDYEQFEDALNSVKERHITAFYSYTISWLAWIRAHSDDWNALADLPKVEAALAHMASLPGDVESVNTHLYLGILNSLRPPALGGKPEVAQDHFEKAVALSSGNDLSVKVEYARGYARMMYDQELHDRLLNEVIAAPTKAPGLTLLNTIAKEQAQALLDSGSEY